LKKIKKFPNYCEYYCILKHILKILIYYKSNIYFARNIKSKYVLLAIQINIIFFASI
jgi:hypothetical protein